MKKRIIFTFALCLGFLVGYGFKTFERVVDGEVMNMKLQNCNRIIVGDIYAPGN